jgi:DNA-binding CsgD family transcriptional regulator
MLVEMHLKETGSALSGPVPPKLAPLFDAARKKLPLEAPASAVVNSLGFSSFVFGMTTSSTLTRDARFYYCTDVPRAWIQEYDQQSFVEIDPRVNHCCTNLTPLIWDQNVANGNERLGRFLERAASAGIGSGVVISLRDDDHSRIMFSVNSPRKFVDETTLRLWTAALGDITLLAVHFHAIFMERVVKLNVDPLHRGAPLSDREKQCLSLAAKGQTSQDIANKLGITERTVNFHFCNLISKLSVANRHEAIAVAITRGFLS